MLHLGRGRSKLAGPPMALLARVREAERAESISEKALSRSDVHGMYTSLKKREAKGSRLFEILSTHKTFFRRITASWNEAPY